MSFDFNTCWTISTKTPIPPDFVVTKSANSFIASKLLLIYKLSVLRYLLPKAACILYPIRGVPFKEYMFLYFNLLDPLRAGSPAHQKK